MRNIVSIQDIADVNPKIKSSISHQKDRNVTFLPMAAISESGILNFQGERKLQEVIKGFTFFQEGDILLAKITPCMENGKAVHACNLIHPLGFGSTEFHVIRPSEQVDGRYLFYMVWNPYFRRIAKKNMTGSAGQKRVPVDFIRRYKIPLPSLPEQKRIAAILDKADAGRRKRQETIRLLDEFLRSVFLEMFGDPVRNEKGWEVDILGNRIKIISGYAFQSERFVEKGIPIIKIGTVNKGYFDTQILSYWPEQYEKKLEKYEVYPRDLLITLTGTVGKDDYGNVCLTNDRYKKYLLNQRVAKLICDHSLNKYYLLYCFKQNRFKNNLIKLSRGIRQANISNEDISNLNISIPPNELQDKFAQFVEKTEYQKEQFKKSLSEMENSFDSMMQKAFRGEL